MYLGVQFNFFPQRIYLYFVIQLIHDILPFMRKSKVHMFVFVIITYSWFYIYVFRCKFHRSIFLVLQKVIKFILFLSLHFFLYIIKSLFIEMILQRKIWFSASPRGSGSRSIGVSIQMSRSVMSDRCCKLSTGWMEEAER